MSTTAKRAKCLGSTSTTQKTENINKFAKEAYTLHIATSVDAKRRVGNTKTASSDRVIALPESLKHDLDTYMEQSYGLQPTDRIFEHISVT